jgi:ribosomal protein S18 acetylase RimI-like enzyme
LNRQVTELEDLVRRWQTGWSLARDWNDYTAEDGIVAVRIGEPQRMVEYVLTDEDPVQLKRAAELVLSDGHPPGASRVTVATADPNQLSPQLESIGLEVLRLLWLMTIPLADQPEQSVRSPYWLETELQPGVIDVRALAAGEPAARGRMTVTGTDAVADMVGTEPAYRRRGLGRAVMGGLVTEAIKQGATDGLLVASPDGLELYRALGWSVAADMVIARSC